MANESMKTQMLQNQVKLNDIPNIKVTDDLTRNKRIKKIRECQKITEKKNKQEWKRTFKNDVRGKSTQWIYLKQVSVNTNC